MQLTPDELKKEGYNLLSYSSDGTMKVVSFIAKVGKRKVYGRYLAKKQAYYIETVMASGRHVRGPGAKRRD